MLNAGKSSRRRSEADQTERTEVQDQSRLDKVHARQVFKFRKRSSAVAAIPPSRNQTNESSRKQTHARPWRQKFKQCGYYGMAWITARFIPVGTSRTHTAECRKKKAPEPSFERSVNKGEIVVREEFGRLVPVRAAERQ